LHGSNHEENRKRKEKARPLRIDCKHVWQHISEYIDGEVDAELRAEIDRHLETCEICSAVLDSTRNVVVLVADARVFEVPTGFSQRLHARLDREMQSFSPDS
jgi:anti-sigma factor (TIGR02949 family)